MSQYVMSKNGGGNVILLTATPFINDPSEMYNMLAYVGKNGMMEM
jgi:N12 class adenine-specific DNA methylase